MHWNQKVLMPSNKLKYGHRNYIMNPEFWKAISKKKDLKLSYKDAKLIIDKSNEIISNIIIEERDGFKLPFGLGYLVATKFIPKNLSIDWKRSAEVGKRVYFANLRTLGYSIRTIWYSFIKEGNRSTSFRNIYMFKSSRDLSRKLSKSFANGKTYCEWSSSDFVDKGRLEKFYDKNFRNKNKEDGSDQC